jgi:hypothetical protein
MWIEEEHQRFNELWRLKYEAGLTETEQQELDQLLDGLDLKVAEMAQSGMITTDQEIEAAKKAVEALRAKNAELNALFAKRQAMMARPREHFLRFQAEHEFLRSEYERIAGHA